VSDGSLSDSETITITVANVNQIPVLNPIGNQTVNEGQLLSFTVSATDVDGDPLTYSARSLPAGASFTGQSFSWTPGFNQAGSYTVTFSVSDGSRISEESITITVVDVPLPDLYISTLSTAPTNVQPGGSLSVSNSISNGGTATAGSFTIAFSLWPSGGTRDIPLTQTRSVSSLAAGATSTATTTVTVPATTPLGTYRICAIPDSSKVIAETNETNNSICWGSIQVTLPDLIMTKVSGPTSAATGNFILVSTTVKNNGSIGIASSTIGIYLSGDTTITAADVLLGTLAVPDLASGVSRTAGIYVSIPMSTTPGTYYLGAIADYNKTRPESNETNNSLTGNSILLDKPDLIISSLSGPTAAARGTTLTITNAVKNQGPVASTGFYVAFYLSTDAMITTEDIYLGWRYLSGLAAGVTNSATTSVTVPSTVKPRLYYLGAIADYNNRITEKSESNNALKGNMITVR